MGAAARATAWVSCPYLQARSRVICLPAVARVAFVFTNPRHHLEMMVPVARELVRRGVSCELISLAEVRGIDSPPAPEGLVMRRALPVNFRRKVALGSGQTERPSWKRRLAQRAISLGLFARLWPILRRAAVVVVPNDAVFPYQELIQNLRRRGTPFVLMQEGIRFPLPNAYSGPAYARGGAAAVCAWGEGSAEHFVSEGVPAASIVVTGAPRFDGLDPDAWTAKGKALLDRLAMPAPIALIMNPIEIQGFGTRDDKHALVKRFLDEIADLLEERQLTLVVKSHAHEDPVELARVFGETRAARWVRVLPESPLFEVLAAARAAIILTSTVGLEALLFRLPLGMLEIPGHPFVFEYVQRDAAVGIRAGHARVTLAKLLDESVAREDAGAAFVKRHFHDRGRAAIHVADAIIEVLARPSES